jgi:hypothetical protein
MTTTPDQVHASRRLDVSLHSSDAPLTLARLVELVDELRRRVEALEARAATGRR